VNFQYNTITVPYSYYYSFITVLPYALSMLPQLWVKKGRKQKQRNRCDGVKYL